MKFAQKRTPKCMYTHTHTNTFERNTRHKPRFYDVVPSRVHRRKIDAGNIRNDIYISSPLHGIKIKWMRRRTVFCHLAALLAHDWEFFRCYIYRIHMHTHRSCDDVRDAMMCCLVDRWDAVWVRHADLCGTFATGKALRISYANSFAPDSDDELVCARQSRKRR